MTYKYVAVKYFHINVLPSYIQIEYWNFETSESVAVQKKTRTEGGPVN